MAQNQKIENIGIVRPVVMPKAKIVPQRYNILNSDTFRSRDHLYHPETYRNQDVYVAKEEIRRADMPDLMESQSCRQASLDATVQWDKKNQAKK
ncbi:hypothetical protein SS50377_25772 [Spironucleus salmonicida]|uniref:Uncharacterized protein n=1 Tax=Spironucleus salmonicida TaxID=348837 RepID=V6LUF1_9EUKA|nr:hypothetical protein SS50377_25772 [Spironucleus salmonicida]|eukprot:EST48252.1 Hypothetical protein SS50377_11593 [Spironucleus salmonicida]